MSLLDYVRLKEYIVTLHNHEDLESIYDDLESEGKSPQSTDITRSVKCLHRRPTSRNTHYFLTAWEAEELKRDPRIKSVSIHPKELGIEAGENAVTQTSSNWNKSTSIANTHKNWGLLRCTEESQRSGWGSDGTTNQTATITLSQTGKNVDVVIVDGDGFAPNHPEFAVNADGTGGSRVVSYNWFQHNPQVTGASAGTYTYQQYDASYHAIHVMGTTGGNTQGWARGANLYNIFYYAGAVGDTNFPYVMDYVREFHRTKSVNPTTGRKNPTICNNSWGMSIFPNQWSLSDITAVTYRGTRYVPDAGGTTTYNGQSGVYSSSALLASFTGNPENIAQRITTSGSETNPTPEASFFDVPETWTQSGNQAYLISLSRPDSTYTVTVNVVNTCTVRVRHNVAVGVSSNTVTASGEIVIVSPAGITESYTSGPFTGTDVETNIEETVTFNEIGNYTIGYVTSITSSSEDIVYATLLDCVLNVTAGTPAATVTDLGAVSIGTTTGLTSSTTPTVGNNDDGYWTLSVPFNVTYLSTNYNTVYVGTNTYTTFGAGSTQWSGITPSSPNLPKIMVGGADNSVQRIYYGTEGISPNRTFRIVVEGNASVSGTLGNPGMKYQYTFYENAPTQIDLVIAQNNRKTVSGGGTFTTGQLNAWGFISGQRIPARVDALDADLENAIDEGIIIVGAAGNGRWKHDIPGGPDWDNTFEMANRYPASVSQPYYYMRGTSPTANDDTINGDYDLPNICVGAVDTVSNEQKVNFSDCGPGVDIYAPGHYIISAWNTSGVTSFVADTRGGGNIAKISGTSMASPQVCGVLACALEVYPDMTQEQAKEYIIGLAKADQLNDTGGGPTDFASLQGSPNRYLFYRIERPVEGNTFPKLNYKLRPATGSVYPRPRIRRTI
jgi:hypothetical protein